MKHLLCSLALLCLFSNGYTQETTAGGGLQTGDKVPDEIWGASFQVVNDSEGRETITLSDSKGKLLILDFWATWCGSCIAAIPKLDALQKQFGNRVHILPVTSQPAEQVLPVWKKNQRLKALDLPVVVADTALKSLFPHRMVPHIAWISDGRVTAITGSGEVNAANIQKVLEETSLVLKEKKDVLDYDYTKPLLVNGNGGDEENFLYRSLFTGYLPGIPSTIGVETDPKHQTTRVYGVNTTVLKLFGLAYRQLRLYPVHRIVVDVGDPARYNPASSSFDNDEDTRHLYCYDLTVPLSDTNRVQQIVLQDIGRYFNLHGRFEQREITYLRLIAFDAPGMPVAPAKALNTTDPQNSKVFHQQLVWKVVAWLNTLPGIPKVINSTGHKGLIDAEVRWETLSVAALRAELQRHGFDLEEITETLEVFVVREGR